MHKAQRWSGISWELDLDIYVPSTSCPKPSSRSLCWIFRRFSRRNLNIIFFTMSSEQCPVHCDAGQFRDIKCLKSWDWIFLISDFQRPSNRLMRFTFRFRSLRQVCTTFSNTSLTCLVFLAEHSMNPLDLIAIAILRPSSVLTCLVVSVLRSVWRATNSTGHRLARLRTSLDQWVQTLLNDSLSRTL